MKFYSEEHILELEKSNKNKFIFFIIVLIFAFLFVGISLIFVDYNNKVIFQIIDSVILSICCFAFLYNLLTNYLPCKKLIDHIDEISYSPDKLIICEILALSSQKTYSKSIKIIEVKIKESGQEKNLYFLADFKNINLEIGKKYKLLVANNFIKEIVDNEI